MEQREDSESVDMEWKSLVRLRGAGACEVGVRGAGAETAGYRYTDKEEQGVGKKPIHRERGGG